MRPFNYRHFGRESQGENLPGFQDKPLAEALKGIMHAALAIYHSVSSSSYWRVVMASALSLFHCWKATRPAVSDIARPESFSQPAEGKAEIASRNSKDSASPNQA